MSAFLYNKTKEVCRLRLVALRKEGAIFRDMATTELQRQARSGEFFILFFLTSQKEEETDATLTRVYGRISITFILKWVLQFEAYPTKIFFLWFLEFSYKSILVG